jgi:hypothetical protein
MLSRDARFAGKFFIRRATAVVPDEGEKSEVVELARQVITALLVYSMVMSTMPPLEAAVRWETSGLPPIATKAPQAGTKHQTLPLGNTPKSSKPSVNMMASLHPPMPRHMFFQGGSGGTTHINFTYPNRTALLNDGWSYTAIPTRNTEETSGPLVVSYPTAGIVYLSPTNQPQHERTTGHRSTTPTTKPKSSNRSAYYTNRSGHRVHGPVQSATVPAGAIAQCADGSYSFSEAPSWNLLPA